MTKRPATQDHCLRTKVESDPCHNLDRRPLLQVRICYKPPPAIRARRNMGTDTPLPQDEPAGENPPDGAVIDYYLKEKATGPVTLDIMDATGMSIRHYASTDTLYGIPDVNIPTYWIRRQEVLSAEADAH